jgi:hypothetical protein
MTEGSFYRWGPELSTPVAAEEPEQLRAGRDRHPEFHTLPYPLLTPRNIHLRTCEPHFQPDRSYSNVFLAHASLYVLGDV